MNTNRDAVTKAKEDFKVDLFRGDRTKLREFLIQLKLVFRLHKTKYPEGSTQVLFAATYLRGPAFSWFEPYMSDYLDDEDDNEDDTDTMFESFGNFEAKLKQVFGVVDEERAAERQIRQLRQKGSAATYYSEFLQLASRLDWDDSAKASAYYMGLSDAVKDQMIPTPPSELQELIDKSIKIDNRLYERRMEKTGYYDRPHKNNYGGGWKKNNNRDYGDPMDLSEMNRGDPAQRGRERARGSGRSRGRGRNSGQEGRDEQKRNNLCFNCNKPGHRAAECAGAAQKLHMMNEEPGIVEKKADTTIDTLDVRDEGTAQKEPELAQEREKFLAPAMIREDATLHEDQRYKHACLSWTACYDDYCTIHMSDKEGGGWFPVKPKRKRKNFRNKISNKTNCRDQESLSMMNDNTSEAETPKEDDDPIKFVVTEVTQQYVVLLTKWWKTESCTMCSDEPRHNHYIFDPETTPKEWVRQLVIEVCQEKDCQYKERIHCHQGNDKKQMEMEIPEEIRQQVWGAEEEENLSMLIEGPVTKTIVIWDERGDEELWSRDFECEDTECPEYYMSNHEHRFNVDPSYPNYKILPEAVARMKAQGRVCDVHLCTWSEYYHLHFTNKDIEKGLNLSEKE